MTTPGESEVRARFLPEGGKGRRRSSTRTRLRAAGLALGELKRAIRSGELTGREATVELIVAREALREIQRQFAAEHGFTGPEALRHELDRLRAGRKGTAYLRSELASLRDGDAVEAARRQAASPFINRQVVARVYRADTGGWAWERVSVRVPRDRRRRWTGLKLS